MSTLKNKDFEIMETQIELAKNKTVSKEKVLRILQEKLKEVDAKNNLIVDKIDGVAIKEILRYINSL